MDFEIIYLRCYKYISYLASFRYFVAGSVFIFLSVYWAAITVRLYVQKKRKGETFKSKIFFPGWKQNKIMNDFNIVFISFISSLICNWIDQKMLIGERENSMEVAILFCYLVHSFVVKLESKKGWFFANVEYVSLFIASASCSLIILTRHGSGMTTPLRQEVHVLLMVITLAHTYVVYLESLFRKSITIPVIRSYLTLLLGTWLYHNSLLQLEIFPSINRWDEWTYYARDVTVTYFVAHCSLDFILTLIFTRFFYKHWSEKENLTLKTEKESLTTV